MKNRFGNMNLKNSIKRVVVFSLVAAVLVAVAFIVRQSGASTKDLIGFLSTSISVFFGAFFAFKFSEYKDDKKQLKSQVRDLNKTFFKLARMGNVAHIMKGGLDGYNNDFELAFCMPATQEIDCSDVYVDFSELEFLLDSSDPDILLALSLEQDRFRQMLQASYMRSKHFMDVFQPIVDKENMNDKRFSVAEMEEAIGSRVFALNISYAKSLSSLVDSCSKQIPVMQSRLLSIAKEMHPDSKFAVYLPIAERDESRQPQKKG